jgi:hypothetical protein
MDFTFKTTPLIALGLSAFLRRPKSSERAPHNTRRGASGSGDLSQ